MLVLQACRMQGLWSHEGFHIDFRGRPGRLGSVLWQGQSSCQESVREQCMKLWERGQKERKTSGSWRCDEHRRLLRKAAGSKQIQRTAEAIWAAPSKVIEMGSLSPLELTFYYYLLIIDAGCAATRLNICSVGFQSSFDPNDFSSLLDGVMVWDWIPSLSKPHAVMVVEF